MDEQITLANSASRRRSFRFEFYHDGLADVPKISVDGTVDNAVHLSHWRGNQTPSQLVADTSTEIALNFVKSPRRDEYAKGIELITNNHFDTDGVLSVWTVLSGERALELSDRLVAAAVAGDFSENTGATAVKASLTIQGSDNPIPDTGVASPLARSLAGASVNESRAYELVLPEVEKVLSNTADYEPLWRDGWALIERALESFERGESRVVEDAESKLSLVTLSQELFGVAGFSPIRHAAPFTAISHNARGELFVIATPLADGWCYRVDYPYYSWAVTIARPPVTRHDLAPAIDRLNELEAGRGSGHWKEDSSELTSALKFTDDRGALTASRLEPETVASEIREVLSSHNAEAAGV